MINAIRDTQAQALLLALLDPEAIVHVIGKLDGDWIQARFCTEPAEARKRIVVHPRMVSGQHCPDCNQSPCV